jgi:hypothetical protein
MSEADVNEGQPFRVLGDKVDLPNSDLSLVIARSGVGKSAALINFALEMLIQGKQVIHFTAGMTSEKAHQYYQEIFNDHISSYPPATKVTWDTIYNNFMVVSYMDPANMISDLQDELNTIISSSNLNPELILVDGLEVHDQTSQDLGRIKAVAMNGKVPLVASMRIHRTGEGNIDLDGPFKIARAHTDHIYFLEPAPEKDRINLERVSDPTHAQLLPIFFCPHNLIFRST